MPLIVKSTINIGRLEPNFLAERFGDSLSMCYSWRIGLSNFFAKIKKNIQDLDFYNIYIQNLPSFGLDCHTFSEVSITKINNTYWWIQAEFFRWSIEIEVKFKNRFSEMRVALQSYARIIRDGLKNIVTLS
jgi:hypothetical protein